MQISPRWPVTEEHQLKPDLYCLMGSILSAFGYTQHPLGGPSWPTTAVVNLVKGALLCVRRQSKSFYQCASRHQSSVFIWDVVVWAGPVFVCLCVCTTHQLPLTSKRQTDAKVIGSVYCNQQQVWLHSHPMEWGDGPREPCAQERERASARLCQSTHPFTWSKLRRSINDKLRLSVSSLRPCYFASEGTEGIITKLLLACVLLCQSEAS